MALSIYTAEQLSTLPFLDEINQLKEEADTYKPLPKETEERILQKFRLDWNYHSNAIEGNKLTYGETVAFIMEGVTAKGKTLKDHLDIQGHDEAVKYLVGFVKEKDYVLSEVDIRSLHEMLLKRPYRSDAVTLDGMQTTKEITVGQYKSMPNHVKTPTGEIHYYATPEDTPIKMGELMEFYRTGKENKNIHPLVLATLFHHEFTSIHPFDDGNGRMGRLLMNLMLMQEGYPPIVVKQEDRLSYYQVLRQADAGEYIPVVEYISELLKHSLNIYVKGAKGESIEEESDIDKEIALFKKGLSQPLFFEPKSEASTRKLLTTSIIPLLKKFRTTLKKIEDLFLSKNEHIQIIKPSSELLSGLSFNNIDQYILMHNKTQLYKMNSFHYELNMITFKRAAIPFDSKFVLYVLFDNAFATVTTSPGNSIDLKYDEVLGESKQNELVSKSIHLLLESFKELQNTGTNE